MAAISTCVYMCIPHQECGKNTETLHNEGTCKNFQSNASSACVKPKQAEQCALCICVSTASCIRTSLQTMRPRRLSLISEDCMNLGSSMWVSREGNHPMEAVSRVTGFCTVSAGVRWYMHGTQQLSPGTSCFRRCTMSSTSEPHGCTSAFLRNGAHGVLTVAAQCKAVAGVASNAFQRRIARNCSSNQGAYTGALSLPVPSWQKVLRGLRAPCHARIAGAMLKRQAKVRKRCRDSSSADSKTSGAARACRPRVCLRYTSHPQLGMGSRILRAKGAYIHMMSVSLALLSYRSLRPRPTVIGSGFSGDVLLCRTDCQFASIHPMWGRHAP